MNIFYNEKLSANFWRSEFRCKGKSCCGGAAPIDMRLIDILQQIRDSIGVALRCVDVQHPNAGSGFRCLTHNATVKDASLTSYHTRGMAADVWSTDVRAVVISDAALQVIRPLTYGRIRLYQTFVHIDTRPKR